MLTDDGGQYIVVQVNNLDRLIYKYQPGPDLTKAYTGSKLPSIEVKSPEKSQNHFSIVFKFRDPSFMFR